MKALILVVLLNTSSVTIAIPWPLRCSVIVRVLDLGFGQVLVIGKFSCKG